MSLKCVINQPTEKQLLFFVAQLNSPKPEQRSYFPFHMLLFADSFHDSIEDMTFQPTRQPLKQQLSQSALHSLHLYTNST